jgi:hypothetical protein
MLFKVGPVPRVAAMSRTTLSLIGLVLPCLPASSFVGTELDLSTQGTLAF